MRSIFHVTFQILVPVPVAVQSRACMSWNTWILKSYIQIPLEMDVYLHFVCWIVLCRQRPCNGPIPVQGVLPKGLKGFTVLGVRTGQRAQSMKETTKIRFLYNEPLLRNLWSLIWTSHKVEVLLVHCKQKLNFPNKT